MPRRSAGILLYRRRHRQLEIFLVHMGGPFWENRDEGAWTIPKGEYAETEDPRAAALREFEEETGYRIEGDLVELQPVRQAGGKIVHAWAVEGDVDAGNIRSNTFNVEWPPNSGRWQAYPEVDRAAWFDPPMARAKIIAAQRALIDEIERFLGAGF
jgi:predicted NUDIX family NTP pyrophosphohydrolase